NDAELKEIVGRVSADLQAIQSYLGQKNHADAKVTFPRGFIRTAAHFRSRFVFLGDETLKRNVAYTLILSDVYRWLLNRTGISGTAKEMIIKEGICLVGSLCESVTKDVLNGVVGKKWGYKDRTQYLLDNDIIDAALKEDLDWVWDNRNNEHLFLVEIWEHEHYKLTDYNRAIKALRNLRDRLDEYCATPF
ncbi:MAG: hypothetical protein KGQ77_12175, partial [Betaproteobacteria bacterium]|nr:hypothetical protein [Betaproteobacteria bacterium]